MRHLTGLLALLCLLAVPAGAQQLHKVKVPDTSRADFPWLQDYMIVLERFPLYAERGWHDDFAGDASLGYFGDARSDENGQRTLSNFIFAYAVLATAPEYDPEVSGVSRQTLLDHCLRAIRYMSRTHLTGGLKCTNGKPWGNHWQSAWWTGKFAAGAHLVWSDLSEADRRGVLRVATYEADRLLKRERMPIGEFDNTRSEENAWDTEVFAWALRLMPDHPHREQWLEMLNRLAFNTLSTAADLDDDTMVAGRKVSEWVEGGNIHSDYTIENHGFFHICYMSCPQHSFAWDWYAFHDGGAEMPAGLWHHVRDVWERTLRFALWDGRFAYVGGKDWPRYAYGLYFIMPALVRYQNEWGDRYARLIERLRLATFEREQRIHNDGSFFSGRFTHLQMNRWPAEWETDAACHLALCYLMHRDGPQVQAATLDELDDHIAGVQYSPESQQIAVRGRRRFASVNCKSNGGPVTALFCSRRGEHMLEWNGNLMGSLRLAGFRSSRSVEGYTMTPWDNGFAAVVHIGEGVVNRPSPWRLQVVDDNVPCAKILEPEHPIFTTPHRVESLRGLTDLDSVTAAGKGWQVLAENARGGPSILQASVGNGVLLVVMNNAEERYTEGDPAGKLWENLVCYTLGVSSVEQAKRKTVAYLAGESWVQGALEKLGIPFDTLRRPTAAALARYDALIIDRTATRIRKQWPLILQYVRAGGRVLKGVVQDRGWRADTIADSRPHAVDRRLAFIALPNDATFLRLEETRAGEDGVRITSADGLGLKVANDIFNGNRRRFRHAGGELVVNGVGGEAREVALAGNWVAVDDELSAVVLDAQPALQLALYDDSVRRAPRGSLCYETLMARTSELPSRSLQKGAVILRSAIALLAGESAEKTRAWSQRSAQVRWDDAGVEVQLVGVDGHPRQVRVDWASGKAALE